MSKPLRNEPCRCGSGRKYKKCCLAADNQVATDRMGQERQAQEQLDLERREFNERIRGQSRELLQEWIDDGRALDDLTNSVVDLVRERRFDEALAACARLLDEYPDVIDGLERSAIVHQAQGNAALAGDFYRRCIAFIEQPEHRDGFDDDAVDYYREQLQKLEQPADSPLNLRAAPSHGHAGAGGSQGGQGRGPRDAPSERSPGCAEALAMVGRSWNAAEGMDADDILHSPLERSITHDGVIVRICIYRGSEDPGWLLEVEDHTGGSTVWDDPFPTDQEALDEAMRTIEAEGIRVFAESPGRA